MSVTNSSIPYAGPTPLDVATMRARAEAASPQAGEVGIYDPSLDVVDIFRKNIEASSGPVYLVWLPDHPGTVGAYPRPDHAVTTAITGNGPTSKQNAELFAHARADVLMLCDEVERLRVPTIEDPELFFTVIFNHRATEAYETAVSKGWYEKPVEDGTRIALMHSELSEALEALRHGNPPDDKVPEFSGVEAELADVVIRILDFAGAKGLNVGGAIVAKMAMNKGRAHKHGGKAF